MRTAKSKKADYRFGKENFTAWLKTGYDSMYLSSAAIAHADGRLDHGFAVFGVLPWLCKTFGLDDNEVFELAIVSRVYIPEEEILAPPAGLESRIIPTDPAWWGADDVGQPIVTWATHPTKASAYFLDALRYVPAENLAYAMRGYGVAVQTRAGGLSRLRWFPVDCSGD